MSDSDDFPFGDILGDRRPRSDGATALQRELRTREADGDGTDTRLVLLEIAQLAGRLSVLDAWISKLAGLTAFKGLLMDYQGLQLALAPPQHPIFERLAGEWAGLDLEEVTVRCREVDDLIDMLLYGARP